MATLKTKNQQDLRKTNFMVFSAAENKEVNGDGNFVQTLITVGVKANVKFVTRFGDKSTKITRPIKVASCKLEPCVCIIVYSISAKNNV